MKWEGLMNDMNCRNDKSENSNDYNHYGTMKQTYQLSKSTS